MPCLCHSRILTHSKGSSTEFSLGTATFLSASLLGQCQPCKRKCSRPPRFWVRIEQTGPQQDAAHGILVAFSFSIDQRQFNVLHAPKQSVTLHSVCETLQADLHAVVKSACILQRDMNWGRQTATLPAS